MKLRVLKLLLRLRPKRFASKGDGHSTRADAQPPVSETPKVKSISPISVDEAIASPPSPKMPPPSINAVLPPEIMEEVFLHIISSIEFYRDMTQVLRTLSLVCTSWSLQVRRLELIRVELESDAQVDRLLQHVKVPGRHVLTRDLTLRSGRDLFWIGARRLPEISRALDLSGLRSLHLDLTTWCRSRDADGVGINLTVREGSPYALPSIRILDLTGVLPDEAMAILLTCNPAHLEHLRTGRLSTSSPPSSSSDCGDTTYPALEQLQLPKLHCLHLNRRDTVPDPAQTLLVRASPNLRVLELHILGSQLKIIPEWLTEHATQEQLHVVLDAVLEHNSFVTPIDPIIRKLVSLIEEKSWTKRITVGGCCSAEWSIR